MNIPSLSPPGLKSRLESGERLTLLDVREEGERAFCAIAVPEWIEDLHIPMGQIPLRRGEIAEGRCPIVVYCHHGVRSMVVARWLAVQGIRDVINLEGGIDAWSMAVDPAVPRY